MDSKTQDEDLKNVRYMDLDNLLYPDDVLLFLRKKLSSFDVDCLRAVKSKQKEGGLLKTKIEKYDENRKKYDHSFIVLESQGFIEPKKDGVSRPYFLTPRGLQLVVLLSDEKQKYEKRLK